MPTTRPQNTLNKAETPLNETVSSFVAAIDRLKAEATAETTWTEGFWARFIAPPFYQDTGTLMPGVLVSNRVDALMGLYPFLKSHYVLVSDSGKGLPLWAEAAQWVVSAMTAEDAARFFPSETEKNFADGPMAGFLVGGWETGCASLGRPVKPWVAPQDGQNITRRHQAVLMTDVSFDNVAEGDAHEMLSFWVETAKALLSEFGLKLTLHVRTPFEHLDLTRWNNIPTRQQQAFTRFLLTQTDWAEWLVWHPRWASFTTNHPETHSPDDGPSVGYGSLYLLSEPAWMHLQTLNHVIGQGAMLVHPSPPIAQLAQTEGHASGFEALTRQSFWREVGQTPLQAARQWMAIWREQQTAEGKRRHGQAVSAHLERQFFAAGLPMWWPALQAAQAASNGNSKAGQNAGQQIGRILAPDSPAFAQALWQHYGFRADQWLFEKPQFGLDCQDLSVFHQTLMQIHRLLQDKKRPDQQTPRSSSGD